MPANILVATDGTPGAAGALRLASRLAERDGHHVEVIAVLAPSNLYADDLSHPFAGLPPHYLPAARDAFAARVKSQLAEIGPAASGWSVRVEMGPVAQTLAKVAAKIDAASIVVGFPRLGNVEQWFARESLLRLIHLAHVPVLAVPETFSSLPSTVLLAVDFSDFSRHAAYEATKLIAPGGRLHVVHVVWRPSWSMMEVPLAPGWSDWEEEYRADMGRRLESFATTLPRPEGVAVETHLATGLPGVEILRLAEEVDADLVAAGSHGTGFIGRVINGSVATYLVHRTRSALLVCPPRVVPSELNVELSEPELLANLGHAGELVEVPPKNSP